MAITFPIAGVGSSQTTPATQTSVVIPAGVVTDDLLILAVTCRESLGDPIVTDDDSGGNAWAKLHSGNNGSSLGAVYWKRATSGTASKTVTVDDNAGDATTSICCALLPVRGASRSATPYDGHTYETNASADESHAAITPAGDGAAIVLCVFNATNDIAPDSQTCTDPGALTAGNAYGESTAGNDCSAEIAAGVQTVKASTGALTWAQVDAATMSIAFALENDGRVTPPVGSLAAVGAAGMLAFSLFTGSGSLALTGQTPTLDVPSGTTITVPAGSLAFTGAAPPLGMTIPVPAGALAVTGVAPVPVTGTLLTPPAGVAYFGLDATTTRTPDTAALTLSGVAPRLDAGVIPAAGAASLTGIAPTASQGTLRSPPAGALTLTGSVPAVVTDTRLTPPVGTATLTGAAPALRVDSRLTPVVGALVLTGVAPTVQEGGGPGNTNLTPGVGALTLTGAAPVPVTGTVLQPPAGVAYFGLDATTTRTPDTAALTLSGVAPRLDAGVIPAAGAASLTGIAPTASQGTLRSPPAGALTLTGSVPAVVTDTRLTPPVGTATLTGVAPTVSATAHVSLTPLAGGLTLAGVASRLDTGLIPGTGVLEVGDDSEYLAPASATLSLTGFAPTLSVPGGSTLTPLVGTLTLTGTAPALRVDTRLTPAAGALALTGGAPIAGLALQPPAGSLGLTGQVSDVQISGTTTLTPGTGALVLTGVAPHASVLLTPPAGALVVTGQAGRLDRGIIPGAGSLTLTGATPSLALAVVPSAGSLSLTGAAPTVRLAVFLTPPAGSLSLAGVAPALVRGTVVTPAAAGLTLTGGLPTLGLAVTCTPATATLTLTGAPPTMAVAAQQPGSGTLALVGGVPTVQIAFGGGLLRTATERGSPARAVDSALTIGGTVSSGPRRTAVLVADG